MLSLRDKKIAFGDNSKVRFSVVRKALYTFLHQNKKPLLSMRKGYKPKNPKGNL